MAGGDWGLSPGAQQAHGPGPRESNCPLQAGGLPHWRGDKPLGTPGHSGRDHTACEGSTWDTEASPCWAARRRGHEGRHSGGLSLPPPPTPSHGGPGGASSSARASRPRGSTGLAVSRGRGHRRGLCAKTNSVRGDRDHAFLYLGSSLPSPKYRRLCGGCRGAGPARLPAEGLRRPGSRGFAQRVAGISGSFLLWPDHPRRRGKPRAHLPAGRGAQPRRQAGGEGDPESPPALQPPPGSRLPSGPSVLFQLARLHGPNSRPFLGGCAFLMVGNLGLETRSKFFLIGRNLKEFRSCRQKKKEWFIPFIFFF